MIHCQYLALIAIATMTLLSAHRDRHHVLLNYRPIKPVISLTDLVYRHSCNVTSCRIDFETGVHAWRAPARYRADMLLLIRYVNACLLFVWHKGCCKYLPTLMNCLANPKHGNVMIFEILANCYLSFCVRSL
jgi:hypothetical protein